MMTEFAIMPLVQACPICGNAPDVDECSPWPKGNGPAAWFAGCYKHVPIEHFVGVNGDNRLDVVRLWNLEVAKVGAIMAEAKAFNGKRSAP